MIILREVKSWRMLASVGLPHRNQSRKLTDNRVGVAGREARSAQEIYSARDGQRDGQKTGQRNKVKT